MNERRLFDANAAPDDIATAIETDGYAIVSKLLDCSTVNQLTNELRPHHYRRLPKHYRTDYSGWCVTTTAHLTSVL
ncbi:MAG: hypothetical protein OEU36_08700 [Gammaproteobacteria bacterium]|nr:hypothetical protein [Gammaproteobacteria bacterium]